MGGALYLLIFEPLGASPAQAAPDVSPCVHQALVYVPGGKALQSYEPPTRAQVYVPGAKAVQAGC